MRSFAITPSDPGFAHTLAVSARKTEEEQYQTLPCDTSTADVAALLDGLSAEPWVVVVDDVTMVRGKWALPKAGGEIALVTAPVRTALGPRIGYELSRSLTAGAVQRLLPMGMQDEAGGTCRPVDLPNDGAYVISMQAYGKLGGLRCDLPLALAMMDFALRAREAGMRIVSDTGVCAMRLAGYAEPTLAFGRQVEHLRSSEQWAALLRGPARMQPRVPVELIIHGGDAAQARQWIDCAGYPIRRIFSGCGEKIHPQIPVYPLASAPAAALREALFEHRGENTVFIDATAAIPDGDWLLRLVEESEERPDTALATLGREGVARRAGRIDPGALLARNARVPVHLVPMPECTPAEFCAQLCDALSAAGLGARQTADRRPGMTALPERRFEGGIGSVAPAVTPVDVLVISGGVADVNELSVSRLRVNTREPYSLAVVVRRSYQDIIKRLSTDSAISILVDASETMGAAQVSHALAASTAEYIAILRDDVITPDGWLEALEAAMARIPQAGIVAPRMSNGSGAQAAETERFANTAEFQLSVSRRRRSYARMATVVQALTQPVFLLRREVLARIGGLDLQLGLSDYAILDLCIRVQAAGYLVVIAEDALVHKVHADLLPKEYRQSVPDQAHARHFSRKWQLGREGIMRFDVGAIAASELAIAQLFCPFPEAPAKSEIPEERGERATFLLPIEDSAAWQRAARLIKKFQRTFGAADNVTLSVGCMGDLDLETAAKRIERIVRDLQIDDEQSADVLIVDGSDREAWLRQLPPGPRLLLVPDAGLGAYPQVKDLSPSGLRKSMAAVGEL